MTSSEARILKDWGPQSSGISGKQLVSIGGQPWQPGTQYPTSTPGFSYNTGSTKTGATGGVSIGGAGGGAGGTGGYGAGGYMDPDQAAKIAGIATRREMYATTGAAGNAASRTAAVLQPGITAAFEASLESVLPGYKDIVDQYAGTVRSQLAGELPEDVIRQIEDFAAEQGVEGGYGGSEFGQRAVARDLGLTSYQVTKEGQTAATALFDVVSSRLRAPTVDQQRLTEAFMQFAAPGSVLRPSDIINASLDSARIQATVDMANSDLAWQQALSQINLGYAQQRDTEERRIYEEALAERDRLASESSALSQRFLQEYVTPGALAT